MSWVYLLFFGVICSQLLLFNSNHIFYKDDGSLSGNWTFNFTIFASEMKGIVLHCFDSRKSQFGIKIQVGRNNPISLNIYFNNQKKVSPMKELCGCDICTNSLFKLYIHKEKDIISWRCNEKDQYGLMSSNTSANLILDDHSDLFPIPDFMKDTGDTLYMVMGNIGPYYNTGGNRTNPLKEQMVACLDYFKYNDKDIRFTNNGLKTEMETSCPNKCSNNSYNEGSLRKYIGHDTDCDCTFKVFSESQCLKSDITNIKTSSWKGYITSVHLSISWSEPFSKIRCIMNVIGRNDTFTIWTNRTHLWMDSKIITKINRVGINSIDVKITNNNLRVQNKEFHINFSLDINTVINVGPSIEKTSCENIRREYDTEDPTEATNGRSTTMNNTNIYMIIFIIIIIIIFTIGFYTTIQLRSRQNKINCDQRKNGVQLHDVQPIHLLEIPSIPHNETDYIYMQNTKQEDTDGYSVIDYTNMYNSIPGTSDEYMEPTIRVNEEYLPQIMDFPNKSSNETDYIYMHNTKQEDADGYSVIDYTNMYNTIPGTSEEYMEPTNHNTKEYAPTLPPRKEK